MTNLTITIDEETLRKARIRALEQGTSVNVVLREFLESFAGVRAEHGRAAHDLLALSRAAGSRRGERKWTRDELHERV